MHLTKSEELSTLYELYKVSQRLHPGQRIKIWDPVGRHIRNQFYRVSARG